MYQSDMIYENFLHSVGYLYTFLMVSSEAQKVLIQMMSNLHMVFFCCLCFLCLLQETNA